MDRVINVVLLGAGGAGRDTLKKALAARERREREYDRKRKRRPGIKGDKVKCARKKGKHNHPWYVKTNW